MYKGYKVCDCFFEVACHCLHTNADFVSFQKICQEKYDGKHNHTFAF